MFIVMLDEHMRVFCDFPRQLLPVTARIQAPQLTHIDDYFVVGLNFATSLLIIALCSLYGT